MTHYLLIPESEENENDHNESINASLTVDKQMDNSIKPFELTWKGTRTTNLNQAVTLVELNAITEFWCSFHSQ